jgi:O-antigen/teichoic acid export membrane protein
VEVSAAEERRILGSRFVRSTAGVLALKVAFVGFSFVLSVVLARLLGAAGYGAYTYAFAWVVLLGVPAILGMDQLIVRDVAAYHLKSDWGSLKGLLRKANQAVFIVSSLLAAIAAGFSWMIARRLGSQALLTFWLALLHLPLITLTRLRQSALQGLHRVAAGLLPEMLVQPMVLLLLIGAAHSMAKGPLTAPSAMALNVAATTIAFVVGARMLRRLLPEPFRISEPVFRKFSWVSSILPLMFLASVGVLFSQVDTLIVGAIKGAKAVGIYGVADRGAESVAFVLIAAGSVFAPTVSRMYAAGETEELQRMVTKFARVTLLVSLPVALVLIFYGHWLLSFFYGPQFVEGRGALAILSLGQVLNVLMGPAGMLLIMTGHERNAAAAMGLSAAGNIVLNLAMVPRWGLEGAATANTISVAALNLLMTMWLVRKLGIQSWALGRISFRRA